MMPRGSLCTLLALGSAAMNTANAQQAEAAAKFNVWEYRVLGNTVLPAIDVERVVYPYLGESKSLADVEAARKMLETVYHDRGYGTVFVDIPEQDVGNGIVRLKVVQGELAHVRLSGARYFSGRQIRAEIPEASKGAVPHLPTLQEQLAAVNAETPDRTVVPILRAGQSPGTVDLSLDVKDRLPLHVSAEVNNQYTANTSELRLLTSLSYDNLFGRLDSLSLQYQTSPENRDEVSVWAASYTTRIGEQGAKIALFFVDSDSAVATAGEGNSTVNVLGNGRIVGLRWVQPLVATAASSHGLIAGIEYKDFKESVFSQNVLETPITYVNLSLGHASAWRAPQRQWSLSSTLNFGVRGLANDTTEFAVKRFHGSPNYFFIRGDGGVAQGLPRGLNLRLLASAQYAADPVISNEQFSAAGASGVRGYLEAEQLGDAGIKTSLELGSPQWNLLAGKAQLDVFGFYDYGKLIRLDPLYEVLDTATGERGKLLEFSNISLASAGLGFNFNAFEHWSGALTWAYPLVDRPSISVDANPAAGTAKGDSRIHFSVRTNW
jgi:hemolysin activation/secretion protein